MNDHFFQLKKKTRWKQNVDENNITMVSPNYETVNQSKVKSQDNEMKSQNSELER